jgi:uncharacterized protein YjlB
VILRRRCLSARAANANHAATPENHAKALKTIPEVKLPKTDPVRGADGPLVRLWKNRRVDQAKP